MVNKLVLIATLLFSTLSFAETLTVDTTNVSPEKIAAIQELMKPVETANMSVVKDVVDATNYVANNVDMSVIDYATQYGKAVVAFFKEVFTGIGLGAKEFLNSDIGFWTIFFAGIYFIGPYLSSAIMTVVVLALAIMWSVAVHKFHRKMFAKEVETLVKETISKDGTVVKSYKTEYAYLSKDVRYDKQQIDGEAIAGSILAYVVLNIPTIAMFLIAIN